MADEVPYWFDIGLNIRSISLALGLAAVLNPQGAERANPQGAERANPQGAEIRWTGRLAKPWPASPLPIDPLH
jgi:hypothetical protein